MIYFSELAFTVKYYRSCTGTELFPFYVNSSTRNVCDVVLVLVFLWQWLGLVFPEHSIYVDSLRECYEAYVIYNFMVYLLNYLNSELTLEANLEMRPQVNHIFPFCCLTPWEMGHEFVHMCKHGILQYTVVRPVTTFISL